MELGGVPFVLRPVGPVKRLRLFENGPMVSPRSRLRGPFGPGSKVAGEKGSLVKFIQALTWRWRRPGPPCVPLAGLGTKHGRRTGTPRL